MGVEDVGGSSLSGRVKRQGGKRAWRDGRRGVVAGQVAAGRLTCAGCAAVPAPPHPERHTGGGPKQDAEGRREAKALRTAFVFKAFRMAQWKARVAVLVLALCRAAAAALRGDVP